MIARSLPPLFDPLSSVNSYLLTTTLEDFLPPALEDVSPVPLSDGYPRPMPFAHHLVYFPPTLPLSSLQADGTDPRHSPGPPFTRRMWVGGKIHYSDYHAQLDDVPAVCFERITDLTIKGQEGQEKALVRIERRARNYEGDDEPKEPEPPFPIEVRTLVFLRDGFRKTTSDTGFQQPKIIKPPQDPDFSHTLVPPAALLFRFSALTFNAHAIHLDKHYCQEVEGHRNLLVHGPLTAVLMAELLKRHLTNVHIRSGTLGGDGPWIESIEYRNLAPLYAEEEMKICGKERGSDEYEMWIEGKEGGLAVRGIVKL